MTDVGHCTWQTDSRDGGIFEINQLSKNQTSFFLMAVVSLGQSACAVMSVH